MFRTVWRFALLFGFWNVLSAAPRGSGKYRIDPNYIKAMAAYRKLEPKMTRQELKAITTVGILNGAWEAEKDMEKHLTELVMDLILNTTMSDKAVAMKKITKIEETIERDKNAIQILASAMDLATKSLTLKEFKNQLQKTLEDHRNKKRELGQDKDIDMARLKAEILNHLQGIHSNMLGKINSTLDYLKQHKELDIMTIDQKSSTKRESDLENLLEEDKEENNLVENQTEAESGRVMNNAVGPIEVMGVDEIGENKTGTQLEDSDEGDEDAAATPPGLLGVIAGLSGGEGGSDVGALVGALTGVISQIFGPGGLDIETLISTGTSLIAGLLAGDRNFGTVLGEYVGTAFDGLSGGGGAVNNGKFLGNLLGTIVASLSADPEDDDQPPKPLVFVQTFVKTFRSAKNRAATPVDGDDDVDDGDAKPIYPPAAGSDSVGFIKQIVSALVGGVTSLILNASLGASGGSSQASTATLTSSSHPQPVYKPKW